MSYRLNYGRIALFIGALAALSYAYVEYADFKKESKKKTQEVSKSFQVRDKGFYNSNDTKKDLGMNNLTTQKSAEGAVDNKGIALNGENTAKEEQKGIGINTTNGELPTAGTTSSEVTSSSEGLTQTTKVTDKSENSATTNKVKQNKEKEQKALESTKKMEQQRLAEIEEQKQAAKKRAEEQAKLQAQKAAEAKKREEQQKALEKKTQQTQQAQAKSSEGKKYIQVATLDSEASAKNAVGRLGGNFGYRKVGNKYVVISKGANNEQELTTLKNEVSSRIPGTKYVVRSAGK